MRFTGCMVTVLLLLVPALVALPGSSASERLCVTHEGRAAVLACAEDHRYGDTPACPGSFGHTGATVVAAGFTLDVAGFDLRCADGRTSDGVFVRATGGGQDAFVTWQRGSAGGGGTWCGIGGWVLDPAQPRFVACPMAPPNPGWGGVLP